MKKIDNMINMLIVISIFTMSTIGVLYSTVLFDLTAENVYGDVVALFGRGIYAYESAFKGPIFIGTDLVMFFLLIIAIASYYLITNQNVKKLVYIGFLTVFLYYVASLAFGTMMNRLFPLYIIAFGLIFFQLVNVLAKYDHKQLEQIFQIEKLPKGIIVFLIIMGLSVSVWLSEIAMLVISNKPSELIGMQSTEPTYIIDLALIAPTCFIAAFQLKHKRAFGVVLSIMMLSLLGAIGLTVIVQNMTQAYFGIEIELYQMIAFVLIFVVLSVVALIYLLKLFKRVSLIEKLSE